MKTTIEIGFAESEESPAWAILEVLLRWESAAKAQLESERNHVIEMRREFPGYGGDSDDYQEMANDQLEEIQMMIARVRAIVDSNDSLAMRAKEMSFDDEEEKAYYYPTVTHEE